MSNPIKWVIDVETESDTGKVNLSVLLAMAGLLHFTGISVSAWEFTMTVPPIKHYLFLGFLLIVSLIAVVCHFHLDNVYDIE